MKTTIKKFERADGVALALLAGVVLVVYWPEATFQRSFFYFDISTLNLPARVWGFAQIRQGYWPHWCRCWETGFPYMAEGQAGILYPPNWLTYIPLGDWRAYTLSFLGHLLVAGVGIYGLARQWCRPPAALLAAGLFVLGGRLIAHQVQTSRVELIAWFPWGLWALERLVQTGRRSLAGWFALILMLQLITGSLHEFILCQVGYVTWLLATVPASPHALARFWRFLSWAVASLAAVLVGAPLLLPTAELYTHSVRATGLDPAMAHWGSAHPYLWPTVMFPYLFGQAGWGTVWLDGRFPWREMQLFHGILTLPLAAVAVACSQARGVRPLLWLAVIGLILAGGQWNEAARWMLMAPGLSSLRIPARFLLLTGVAVCVLAALGWETLARRPRPRFAFPVLLGTVAAGFLMATASAWHAYGNLLWPTADHLTAAKAAEIAQGPFGVHMAQLLRAEWPWTLGVLVLGLAAAGIACRWPKVAVGLFMTVTFVEMGRYARSSYPTLPPSFHATPASITFLKQQSPAPRVYLARQLPNLQTPGFFISLQPYLQIGECLYWERGPLFGVSLVSWMNGLPLELRRNRDFHRALSETPWYFQLLGTEWIMSPIPLNETRLAKPPAYSGTKCFIYRTRQPAPFARVVPHVVTVGKGEALPFLVQQPADPANRVVIESVDSSLALTVKDVSSEKVLGTSKAAVTAHWSGPNVVTLTLPAGHPGGLLVVRETYYPGWAAHVDGEPAPVIEADGLFLAVPVTLATRQVVLRFTSRFWGTGLVCASFGLFILGWLLVGKFKMFSPCQPQPPVPREPAGNDLPRVAEEKPLTLRERLFPLILVVVTFALPVLSRFAAWRAAARTVMEIW